MRGEVSKSRQESNLPADCDAAFGPFSLATNGLQYASERHTALHLSPQHGLKKVASLDTVPKHGMAMAFCTRASGGQKQ
jgi:hypothetical protein